MKYTVYKIINKIDGKFYIGVHQTNDLDDGYYGSGKYLKHAVNKYGINNFKKEILYFCDSPEEMYAKEEVLVNEEFVSRKDTYNLKVGGMGGWDYININCHNNRKNHRKTGNYGWKKRHILTEDEKIKLSNSMKYYFKTHIGTFTGKKHTEEAKKKISDANKINQLGKRNSQYNKRWISNLKSEECIAIDISLLKTYLEMGWINKRILDFKLYHEKMNLKNELRNKKLERKILKVKNKNEVRERKISEDKEKLLPLFNRYKNGESLRNLAKECEFSHVTLFTKFKNIFNMLI